MPSNRTSPTAPRHVATAGNNRWMWLLGCGLAALVAVVVLKFLPEGGRGRGQRRPPSDTTTASSPATPPTDLTGSAGNTGTSVATDTEGHSSDEISLPALQKVIGRWKRVDADYVLKFKSVDAQGKLDATYLNPSQIHVEKAVAHSHGDQAHITVELRDVNYPGCIYDLHFDPATDQLKGTYFQAALGETYDVAFKRSE